MAINELKARARVKASAIRVDAVGAVDRLRDLAMPFFAKVPEPPVYRRRDDPAIGQAQSLLLEAEALLAQAYAVEGALRDAQGGAWSLAIERHLEALSLLSEGRIEAAEGPWHEAIAAERAATASKRLWSRVDDEVAPVFDKGAARSRYDPVPEASLKVKLVCATCRRASEYACSPRHATHQFTCTQCGAPFSAYLAEARACDVKPLAKGRRYDFRLEELGGALTQLQVDDWGRDALPVARRDLLAFLYAPSTQLRGVLNLSSSRVLWVSPGKCFVATVAFGDPGAPELEVLRAFRDQRLARSRAGRAFIEWYYREGPRLAAAVSRRPGLKRIVRSGLRLGVEVIRRGLW